MEPEKIIQQVRTLRVLVLHPRDGDAEELLQQLNRIGCGAQAIWPAPAELTDAVDLIFVEVREKRSEAVTRFLQQFEEKPTVIGMTGYESPSVLDELLELEVDGVLAKPVRPYGVLSCMVTARRVWQRARKNERMIAKLRSRVENSQKMNEAKFVLMRLHGIEEDDAYRAIRQEAMESRRTVAEVAQAIVESHALLHTVVRNRGLEGQESGAKGAPPQPDSGR